MSGTFIQSVELSDDINLEPSEYSIAKYLKNNFEIHKEIFLETWMMVIKMNFQIL